MANRAYLLAVDDRSITWSKDPEREVLAEGINEIPVFWASLFVAGDRQVDAYDTHDGEKLEVANWCAESAVAKQRLTALGPKMEKLLDERTHGLWEQWVEFIAEQECRYFKTNAAEVWGLHTKDYEQYWAVLLRAFEKPSAKTWRAAVERNGLDVADGEVDWDDEEVTACKLAGADHIQDLPWLD